MSVKYNEHTAIASVDPDADWLPRWDTSSNAAARASVNNTIALATLPGGNLVASSVPYTKLPSQAVSTLLGRRTESAGVPEIISISPSFLLTGGILQLANNYQPLDADLTAIAALTTQTFGRSVLVAANAAALRALAELVTPTGWGTTDRLVTTHVGAMLVDVGAEGLLSIIPISSATNVALNLQAKGVSALTLLSGDAQNGFSVDDASFVGKVANINVLDMTSAQLSDLVGVLVVDWQNRVLHSSWSSEGFSITGKFSVTSQAVTLGAGIVTFQANQSYVVLTGNVGTNTLTTITGGVVGMELTIFFVDALVSITDTAAATADTINLTSTFDSTANTFITLKFQGGKWFEKSRSASGFIETNGDAVLGDVFLQNLAFDSGKFVFAEATGDFTLTGKVVNIPQSVTLGAAAITFAVTSSFVEVTGDGGANTVLTITGGVDGMELTLFFVDGLVTVTDTAATTANTVNLSAAFTSSANDVLTLVFHSGKWFEKSRSVN